MSWYHVIYVNHYIICQLEVTIFLWTGLLEDFLKNILKAWKKLTNTSHLPMCSILLTPLNVVQQARCNLLLKYTLIFAIKANTIWAPHSPSFWPAITFSYIRFVLCSSSSEQVVQYESAYPGSIAYCNGLGQARRSKVRKYYVACWAEELVWNGKLPRWGAWSGLRESYYDSITTSDSPVLTNFCFSVLPLRSFFFFFFCVSPIITLRKINNSSLSDDYLPSTFNLLQKVKAKFAQPVHQMISRINS